MSSTLPRYKNPFGNHLRKWLTVQYQKFAHTVSRGVPVAKPNDNETSKALLRGFGRELIADSPRPHSKEPSGRWSIRIAARVLQGLTRMSMSHIAHCALGNFKTIQMVTSNPLLPWELMRPLREDGTDERDFLGIDYNIGRWHFSMADRLLDRPPQSMSPDNLLVIAPRYAGQMALPGQQTELYTLLSMPGVHRLAGDLATLRALFADPPNAMIHFAIPFTDTKQFALRLTDALPEGARWYTPLPGAALRICPRR